MTKDDLIDNDCDGQVDEEKENGKDDDGDGKIDEDMDEGDGGEGGTMVQNSLILRHQNSHFPQRVAQYLRPDSWRF